MPKSLQSGSATSIIMLVISETRWTQTGETRLANGVTILYSGQRHKDENAHHTQGMGLLISKKARASLSVGNLLKLRLFWLVLKLTLQTLILLRPSATHPRTIQLRDEGNFKDKYQTVLDKTKTKDFTFVMEDLNAKVG